jgi:hypothetical protein
MEMKSMWVLLTSALKKKVLLQIILAGLGRHALVSILQSALSTPSFRIEPRALKRRPSHGGANISLK